MANAIWERQARWQEAAAYAAALLVPPFQFPATAATASPLWAKYKRRGRQIPQAPLSAAGSFERATQPATLPGPRRIGAKLRHRNSAAEATKSAEKANVRGGSSRSEANKKPSWWHEGGESSGITCATATNVQ
jgi:hypothetical protein